MRISYKCSVGSLARDIVLASFRRLFHDEAMPLVVRQSLARRLSALPELTALLRDVRMLTGIEVVFSSPLLEEGPAGPRPAPLSLCAHVQRFTAGCVLCNSFHQKLRESATRGPHSALCDAGLWELAVPVTVGTQGVGHLMVIGLREGEVSMRARNRARHLLGRQGIDVEVDTLSRLFVSAPLVEAERREALGHLLSAVAAQVARRFTDHLSTPVGTTADLVEQAYRLVHAEYAGVLRVPQLADRLGVSAAHLSRTFHRATGLRLVDYISRYRAERARLMLQEGTQRVAAVARACGFQSVSQFNRVFRVTFGVAPRDMRQIGPGAGALRGR